MYYCLKLWSSFTQSTVGDHHLLPSVFLIQGGYAACPMLNDEDEKYTLEIGTLFVASSFQGTSSRGTPLCSLCCDNIASKT